MVAPMRLPCGVAAAASVALIAPEYLGKAFYTSKEAFIPAWSSTAMGTLLPVETAVRGLTES
jgi:hypothetical protein